MLLDMNPILAYYMGKRVLPKSQMFDALKNKRRCHNFRVGGQNDFTQISWKLKAAHSATNCIKKNTHN